MPSELRVIGGYSISLLLCPLACHFRSCFVILWSRLCISIRSKDATYTPPRTNNIALALARQALSSPCQGNRTQSTPAKSMADNPDGEDTESAGGSESRGAHQGVAEPPPEQSP